MEDGFYVERRGVQWRIRGRLCRWITDGGARPSLAVTQWGGRSRGPKREADKAPADGFPGAWRGCFAGSFDREYGEHLELSFDGFWIV